MRQLLRELAGCGLLLGALPIAATAQQGSVKVSAGVHAISGDAAQTAGQPTLESDMGVSWLRPGTRFGTFQMELRGATRDGDPRVGRSFVSLRDFKHGGVTYTLEGGDSFFTSKLSDHQFPNLYTPGINFAGVHVKATTAASEAAVMFGRATTTRDFFGTDPSTLGQSLFIARGTHKATPRLTLSARASRIRTRDLDGITFAIADSDQAGGGARFLLTPAVHLVSEGSVVRYRPRDEPGRMTDASALAGVSVLLARGWIQMNASRYSPGELPILSQPLADRRTKYAAGEYDAFSRIRLFGGLESFEENPHRHRFATRPPADGTRRFGGVRVRFGGSTTGAVRVDMGDRRSRLVGAGLLRVSDTGVISTELQTTVGALRAYGRFSRRENVQSDFEAGSYTQQEASGLTFFNVNRNLQLFGSVTALRSEARNGSGQTFWQSGGGTQAQLFRRGVWLRAEALFSRNVDLLSDILRPRHTVNLGLNGEIAPNLVLAFNTYADRMPEIASAPSKPWIVRSSVRLTRTFHTSTAPVSGLLREVARHGGTGSVRGMVFTDWNGDGVQDSDEPPVSNIPISLANLGSTTTSPAGEFAFVNIPIGLQQVGIDMSSLPVDFDPPPVPQLHVQVDRGETYRLSFGVIPLGSIAGRVLRDVNGNGAEDALDTPLDAAVVVLDGGARSEQTKAGRFRFDAVRAGEHTVTLLQESLPDGSMIDGPSSTRVAIARGALVPEVTLLVTIQDRPEIRRVFPAEGSNTPPARPPVAAPGSMAAGAAGRPSRIVRQGGPRAGRFAVQIAALNDRSRALGLTNDLRSRGFSAYLVEPQLSDPEAPYRVRVGFYGTREEAERAAQAFEQQLGYKLWVIREQ